MSLPATVEWTSGAELGDKSERKKLLRCKPSHAISYKSTGRLPVLLAGPVGKSYAIFAYVPSVAIDQQWGAVAHFIGRGDLDPDLVPPYDPNGLQKHVSKLIRHFKEIPGTQFTLVAGVGTTAASGPSELEALLVALDGCPLRSLQVVAPSNEPWADLCLWADGRLTACPVLPSSSSHESSSSSSSSSHSDDESFGSLSLSVSIGPSSPSLPSGFPGTEIEMELQGPTRHSIHLQADPNISNPIPHSHSNSSGSGESCCSCCDGCCSPCKNCCSDDHNSGDSGCCSCCGDCDCCCDCGNCCDCNCDCDCDGCCECGDCD